MTNCAPRPCADSVWLADSRWRIQDFRDLWEDIYVYPSDCSPYEIPMDGWAPAHLAAYTDKGPQSGGWGTTPVTVELPLHDWQRQAEVERECNDRVNSAYNSAWPRYDCGSGSVPGCGLLDPPLATRDAVGGRQWYGVMLQDWYRSMLQENGQPAGTWTTPHQWALQQQAYFAPPQQQPGTFTVQIPADWQVGQPIQVRSPVTQQMVQMEVPAGYRPGMQFQVAQH